MSPTVIITGASRGLGAASAQAAAQAGANVFLVSRSPDALESIAQKIMTNGGTVLAVAADLNQPEACRSVVQQAVDHFGSIDALINNAGQIEPIARIADADLQDWEAGWSINFFAPLRLIQLALPYLRQSHGRVINITSGTSTTVIQGWGAYSTAKAAIDHLTRILAHEEPDITALAVRPGILDTDMQAAIREKGRGIMSEVQYQHLYSLYRQNRLVSPDTVGKAIAALAMYAPHEWSGNLVQWDDPQVQALIP